MQEDNKTCLVADGRREGRGATGIHKASQTNTEQAVSKNHSDTNDVLTTSTLLSPSFYMIYLTYTTKRLQRFLE